MDGQRQNEQKIVTECSPSFCNCDIDAGRCLNGYDNNRGAAQWIDSSQGFHLDRVQQRIDASMQPSYQEEPISMLRRRMMANRLLTQQTTEHSVSLRRRTNVSFANTMLYGQSTRQLVTQPFGQLVPEQVPGCSLQRLAAPQGQDHLIKDKELTCRHEDNYCISGDTDSDKSLEQSRKRQK